MRTAARTGPARSGATGSARNTSGGSARGTTTRAPGAATGGGRAGGASGARSGRQPKQEEPAEEIPRQPQGAEETALATAGSKQELRGAMDGSGGSGQEIKGGVFHIIEQLAVLEAVLWCILDGLKSNAPHVSFFCREYWGTSASSAQLSLEKLGFNDRLKRQVTQAGVLESMSLAVAAHLCTGVMQGVSVTIRSRLRNLLYYIHENCLVLLDLICQRWLVENPTRWAQANKSGHCPENLNLDILVRVKRYRCLRKGEHFMALRQHNDMIANVVRQLCRGATTRRVGGPTVTNRRPGGATSPGPQSRSGAGGGNLGGILAEVNEILQSRTALDRQKPSVIRNKMLAQIRFSALLNVDNEEDCPWPAEDPFALVRAGHDSFAQGGPIIWFEPLPPMYPDLEGNPTCLPPLERDTWTLVLDLDETLVHYFEMNGQGTYDIRPGAQEFLLKMNQLGYEVVIFTAATQDYADWVIDQIDPTGLIHYRRYRQHALPWGPIFVKDLSRLGRDLDRTLIIDNVQENFMLQPNHGIFIFTWYDDPNDTALFALTPLLDELISTRTTVPEILDKYAEQIPGWAGFEKYDDLDYELEQEELPYQPQPQQAQAQALLESYQQQPQQMYQQQPQEAFAPPPRPGPQAAPQQAVANPGGALRVEAKVVSGQQAAQPTAPRFAGGPCQAPPPQPVAPRFAGGPCQAPPPGSQPGTGTPGAPPMAQAQVAPGTGPYQSGAGTPGASTGMARMAPAPAFAAGVGPYQAARPAAAAGAPYYGRAQLSAPPRP